MVVPPAALSANADRRETTSVTTRITSCLACSTGSFCSNARSSAVVVMSSKASATFTGSRAGSPPLAATAERAAASMDSAWPRMKST